MNQKQKDLFISYAILGVSCGLYHPFEWVMNVLHNSMSMFQYEELAEKESEAIDAFAEFYRCTSISSDGQKDPDKVTNQEFYTIVCDWYKNQRHPMFQKNLYEAIKKQKSILKDEEIKVFLNALSENIFDDNARKGFWDEGRNRNRPEMIALMHSELSECLEGIRKPGMMDDHLPHRTTEEVELADALIRIMDYAGGFDIDLGGSVAEKLAYNRNRPHKHGKKF